MSISQHWMYVFIGMICQYQTSNYSILTEKCVYFKDEPTKITFIVVQKPKRTP